MKKEKYIKIKKYKKSTYYTVQFTYEVAGEKHTYSKTFGNMKDAVKHRDLKRAELITTGLPTGKRTLAQMLDDMHRIHRTPLSTVNRHKCTFNHIAEYHGCYISEIQPIDIQRSLNAMIYDYSQEEIRKVFTLWKQLCDTAILEGFLTVSPIGRVILPNSKKITEERPKLGSDESFAAIIEYLEKDTGNAEQNYNNKLAMYALKIMFCTGMRPAEVMALTRDSIDLANHTIHVKTSVGSDEISRNVIKKTKTGSSVREIPMSIECELNVRALLAMSLNDKLFILYNGNFPCISFLSSKVSRIAKKIGVEFHSYMLRHRMATKLVVEANADLRTVKEILGHTNINTTVDVYSHSNINKKKKVLEEMVESSRKLS